MCEKMIKNPYRRVWACVNLDALHDNLRQIAACRKNDAGIIAVIKADGYGHGAVMLAREMDEIPEVIGYAVATEEEAVLLADAGIKKPVMVLGYTFPEAYEEMALRGVHATVFTDQMLEDMNRAAQKAGKKMHVHIAVDTGMSRIGIRPDDEGLSFVARAMQCPNLSIEGIFTHFATADEADKSRTNVQYEKFSSFTDRVEKELSLKIPLRHCSNSASILELPDMHMDAVRAGIILYGMWPSDEVKRDGIVLEPLLSLKSRIAYIKELDAGQEISYGGTFCTANPMRVATIPVGYADGYPRGLSNKGDVLIAGQRARILGRVCMDQFMVDVTKIPEAKVGDIATLIGTDGIETITMEEIGDRSGRFNYETACCLGKRIPRVYEKGGKIVCTRDYFHEEKLFF